MSLGPKKIKKINKEILFIKPSYNCNTPIQFVVVPRCSFLIRLSILVCWLWGMSTVDGSGAKKGRVRMGDSSVRVIKDEIGRNWRQMLLLLYVHIKVHGDERRYFPSFDIYKKSETKKMYCYIGPLVRYSQDSLWRIKNIDVL